GTNAIAGMQFAENVLNDKVNSDLPTNFQVNGFRQILINVNDSITNQGPCGTDPSLVVNFQSSTLTPDGSYSIPNDPSTGLPCWTQAQITPQGPANQFAYSVITTASGVVLPRSNAYAVNCWQSAYTFIIIPNQTAVATIVNQVVDSACAEPSCSCPDGYTLIYPDLLSSPVIWNQETGDCESFVLDNLGTDGNGEPVDETQSLECPIDLVFVLQADDSTSEFDPFNPQQKDVMVNFVEQFLQNGDIQNAINNNNMQVGITMHAREFLTPGCVAPCVFCSATNINYNASINDRFNFGFPSTQEYLASADANISRDASSIANGFRSWLYSTNPTNWIGDRPGLGSTWGVDYGQRYAIENVINLRGSNSQLGDRSSDPNYRAFVFHITGVVNSWNIGYPDCFTGQNISQANLSPNQVTGGLGPDNLYSMLSYMPYNDGRNPVAPGGWLSPLYGNSAHLFTMDDIQNPLDYSQNVIDVVNLMKQICNNPTSTVDVCDCFDYQVTILGDAPLPEYDIIYQECITGTYASQKIPVNTPTNISCIRPDNISFVQSLDPNLFSIVQIAECEDKYDCNSGPTQGPTFTTIDAICRKIDCDCPPSPIPNATLTQSGPGCESLPSLLFDVGDPNFVIPPGLIVCDYQALLEVPPSFERGSIWRHNYRCDLYANYYDVDYPWEVELVENTGQAVNTIRSFEYQLESYVYKGDLINGCGDDRWHDLDFNFDKSIIYNSEQVSGLLTLIPHPKEDPLTMITYPIIGGSDIQILYSKEEQKYRFNQFWDITRDRDEFTTYPAPTYQYQPGVTPLDSPGQNIFITQLNGYIKDLNQNNLAYSKTSDQRKKLRHYYNKVLLRRTLSGNRKMLLKLLNTKLNLSIR
ncbi:MAG: hypothetical protein ACXADH_08715, partial [Candidatus Kariarchaeaceae archaeon]